MITTHKAGIDPFSLRQDKILNIDEDIQPLEGILYLECLRLIVIYAFDSNIFFVTIIFLYYGFGPYTFKV